MKIVVYLSALLTGFLVCHTNMVTKNPAAIADVPPCIQQKIDSIKVQLVWNPPAEIDEYEYAGRKIFVISAKCCDFYATAIDSDCNYVCAPSGGITGKGDRKCADFNEKAKHIRLVWKDDREKK